ncbi:MAG: hypothetical protein GX675_01665 [Erysipelotrichaceae bacterium]|nr:hypothetical protein [Erysipelotrichaceae bacterium]
MEINNRKIIQSFIDKPIDGKLIDALIESFSDVNGAKNESWFLVFIYRKSIIREIALLSKNKDIFKGANTVVIAFAKKGPISNLVDAAFAIHNMIDTATNLGLDAYYDDEISYVFNDPTYEKLGEVCGVKEGYMCVGSISLGYALDYKLEDKFKGDVISIIL